MKQITLRKFAATLIAVSSLVALARPALSQDPALKQKVDAVKQSIAQNQQSLRTYTWTETMDTLLKGEVKSTKISQCQYGADGTVVKTPLTAPPPPSQARGIKGRIVEKKKGEIEDYMERVASLIKRYVPPSGAQIQASFQSGQASFQPSGDGLITLILPGYALPGDTVKLTFDTGVKKIRAFSVNTYLDSPSDVVTLNVVFDSLPDGTNYVTQSVLDATAKQVQIRTTSAGYRKL